MNAIQDSAKNINEKASKRSFALSSVVSPSASSAATSAVVSAAGAYTLGAGAVPSILIGLAISQRGRLARLSSLRVRVLAPVGVRAGL